MQINFDREIKPINQGFVDQLRRELDLRLNRREQISMQQGRLDREMLILRDKANDLATESDKLLSEVSALRLLLKIKETTC